MSKTELQLLQQQYLYKSEIECQFNASQKVQSITRSFENKFGQTERNNQVSGESFDDYVDDKNKNTLSISDDEDTFSQAPLQRQRKIDKDLKFYQKNMNQDRFKNDAYIAFLEQEDLQQNPTEKALCVSFNDENGFQKILTERNDYNIKPFNQYLIQQSDFYHQQNDDSSIKIIENLKSEIKYLKKELENEQKNSCILNQGLQQKILQIQDLQMQFENTHNLLQYSEQILKKNKEKRSRSKDFTRNVCSQAIDQEQKKFIDELIQTNYLKDNQIIHLKSELTTSNLIISKQEEEIQKLSSAISSLNKDQDDSNSIKITTNPKLGNIQNIVVKNETTQRNEEFNIIKQTQYFEDIQNLERKIEILQGQKQKIHYLDDNFMKIQNTPSLEQSEYLQDQILQSKNEQVKQQNDKKNIDSNSFGCQQKQKCNCSTANSFKTQPNTLNVCQFSQLERELFSNPQKSKDFIQNSRIEMESFNLSPIKNKSQKHERSITYDRSCFSTILNMEELTYRDISRNTPYANIKVNTELSKQNEYLQQGKEQQQNTFQSNLKNIKDLNTFQSEEKDKEENNCSDFYEFVEKFHSNKNHGNVCKQSNKLQDFQKYQQDHKSTYPIIKHNTNYVDQNKNKFNAINIPNLYKNNSNTQNKTNQFDGQYIQAPHTTKECSKRFIFEHSEFSTNQKEEITQFPKYFEGKRRLSLNSDQFIKQDPFYLQFQNKNTQESPFYLKESNNQQNIIYENQISQQNIISNKTSININKIEQNQQNIYDNNIQIQQSQYYDYENNNNRISYEKLNSQQFNKSNEQPKYLNNKEYQSSQSQESYNRINFQNCQQNAQNSSKKQIENSNSKINEISNHPFLYQNNNQNKQMKNNGNYQQIHQNNNDLKNRINLISSIETKELVKTPVNINSIQSSQQHQNFSEEENNRLSHNTIINSTPKNISDLFTSTPKENLTNLISGNNYHLQQKYQDKHDFYKLNNMPKLNNQNHFEIQQSIKSYNQGQINQSPLGVQQLQEQTQLNKIRRGSFTNAPTDNREQEGTTIATSQNQIRKQMNTQGNESTKNMYSNYTIIFNQNEQKSIQNGTFQQNQQQVNYKDQAHLEQNQYTNLPSYNQNNIQQKSIKIYENKENISSLQNQNVTNNKPLNNKNITNEYPTNSNISSNLERLREVKNRVRELNLDNDSSSKFLLSSQKENLPPSHYNKPYINQCHSNKNANNRVSCSAQGKQLLNKCENNQENTAKSQRRMNKNQSKEQPQLNSQKNQLSNESDNISSILKESKKINKNIPNYQLQQSTEKRNTSQKSRSKDNKKQHLIQNSSLRKSTDNTLKSEKKCIKHNSEQKTRKKSQHI